MIMYNNINVDIDFKQIKNQTSSPHATVKVHIHFSLDTLISEAEAPNLGFLPVQVFSLFC